jgi:DSF synthase
MLRELIVLHRQMQSLAASQGPEEQPFIRYFILASKIPGIYNMGGDLLYLANKIRDRDRTAVQYYAHRCVDVVYNINAGFDVGIVSVALIEGDALGGGLEAALSCNFIIAERGIKIGMPEVLFNLFPGMGAYSMLSRRVGSAMAERMMLSGRIFDADQLYQQGVIDQVVDPGAGKQAIADYLADTRKFPARLAIYRARQRANPITLTELKEITNNWVDTALQLSEIDLRHMLRLQSAQSRRLRRVPAPNSNRKV